MASLSPKPAAFKTGLQRGTSQVATFNKIFSTQRLVQIIVVLGAAVLMKLLA